VVTDLGLEPCFGFSETAEFSARTISIASAAPLGEESEAGDIVAFWVPKNVQVRPASLSLDQPKVGQRVWLAAGVYGGDFSERLHAATVTSLKEGSLYYSFDFSETSMQATSGAPVLDENGSVVAIHVGFGTSSGQLIGVGNPVVRFRKHLERAIEKDRQP